MLSEALPVAERGNGEHNFSGTLCARSTPPPPTRGPMMVRPGPKEAWPAPLARSLARLEARSRRPRLGRLGGRCRAAAAAPRTVATGGGGGGGMDYLTTFTGKSGRLLRGTASRLWGLGGGGGGGSEARQVRFEDLLREPAPGDPGCGPAEQRPPSPASPEGPGECPGESLRRLASLRADGDRDRDREAAPRRGGRGQVCGPGQVCEPPRDWQLPGGGPTYPGQAPPPTGPPVQCGILPLPGLLQPVVTCTELDFQNARVCSGRPLLWSRVGLGCVPAARAPSLT